MRRPFLFVLPALALLLSMTAAPAAVDPIFIKAGRLLDVKSGSIVENAGILIEGNRITAVGPKVDPPKGVQVLDLKGMTVLPGLVDSHTHICLVPADEGEKSPVLYKTNPYRALTALDNALADMMAGFTSLRDVDNEGADMADIAVRDAINDGIFLGPRLKVAGWAISITGGHMNLTGLSPSVDRKLGQLAIMADDRDAMIKGIRDQVKSGVDLIKIYATGTMRHIDRKTMEPLSQLSQEDVEAMVKEAARWRVDVAAHAYGGEGAYNAVAGGVRSIEHGMFLDDRTLDLMVSKGTYWIPTMTVYFPRESDTPEEKAFSELVVARHKDTFQRAMKKGVKIAFGTDSGAIPHGDQYRELALMVSYGMTPVEAIRSATVTGAALMEMDDTIGKIAPGYFADIIAVKGEPDQDIAALRQVPFVMVDGKIAKYDL